ncbi:hypothetical protein DL546_009870 [Coniochaeta pulveracea]|uniref:Pali-domain-containing protein n=1 Tax=Coniochaeta pulveracea TaxID=177199 RepID=A0A420YP87_9PEZI|nr:hypothetical protein DL546_009870 [Coniochaeta pulveracea]
MARTGFLHHIGTFLLFAATVLLIITCISSPVVRHLSILRVDYRNTADSSVSFGTFGYCLNNVGNGGCSKSHVGYRPADVMTSIEQTQFSDYSRSTTKILTRVMILHPIACGLNFIAFLLAAGAGVVGSFLASVVALVAFLTTVVIMIIDFVLFSIIRSNVNDDRTNSHAHYGAAAWTILVAAICSLLGTIIVFFTCCSARLHKRRNRDTTVKHEYVQDGYAPPATRTRRRWF